MVNILAVSFSNIRLMRPLKLRVFQKWQNSGLETDEPYEIDDKNYIFESKNFFNGKFRTLKRGLRKVLRVAKKRSIILSFYRLK